MAQGRYQGPEQRDSHLDPTPGRPVPIPGHPSLTGKWMLAYGPEVGDVFKALADPTRRAILDELTERDGQSLFEICARLANKHGMGSTRQAISQHLEVLESAGLVTTRREGRYKFHHLDTAPLRQIAERWSIPDPER
jgi:DNA-binding transcriptional ArsR family regulator